MSSGKIVPISESLKIKLDDVILDRLCLKEFKTSMKPGSEKGDNYLGEIFKVLVEGILENGVHSSTSLIVKQAPNTPAYRSAMAINKIYSREIFIYTRMLPHLYGVQERHSIPYGERFDFAKFFKGVTDDCDETMIMEDLMSKRYRMHDRLKPFDFEHLSLCVKNLARYHATTYYVKAKEPEVYAEFASRAMKIDDFLMGLEGMFDGSIDNIKLSCDSEEKADKVIKFGRSYSKKFEAIVSGEDAAPYVTLCHGDCWSNNFLFRYDEDDQLQGMIMIDWQMMRETSPVTDMMYMLYAGSDKEMRRKHLSHLFDLYYETLSRATSKMGVDISDYYPEHIYRAHIKKYTAYGLLTGLSVLPITLNNKPDTIDIELLIENAKNNKPPEAIPISDYCRERIRDVIDDCIDHI